MDKYKKYKAINFLKDEFFLSSFLLSTGKDVFFWDDFISKNPDKREEFEWAKRILRSVKFNDETFSEEEKLEILCNINQSVVLMKQRKCYLRIYQMLVVACVAGLIAFGYVFVHKSLSIKKFAVVPEYGSEQPVEKNTQLILADKETITFDEEAEIIYKKGGKIVNSANKEVLVLNVTDNETKYNKLVVPKGKRASQLVLEDGSKVWVNSGSTLEFPLSFTKDRREVVVEGEIYIEVAKDAERPFYVRTSEMNVKVLGTRFNISAYQEDSAQSVVLVEGLVEVKSKDESKKKILLPDHKLTVTSEVMDITQVNTYDYISWKDGLLQFNSRSLFDILTKLSRYYNVEIACEPDIKEMKCTGKLVLFEELTDVLQTISYTISFEKMISNDVQVTYEIMDKCVYIKKI